MNLFASSDASLKQRLEREAKAISKLSGILTFALLYDIPGHQDGIDFPGEWSTWKARRSNIDSSRGRCRPSRLCATPPRLPMRCQRPTSWELRIAI